MMLAKKPEIVILEDRADQGILREICAGIEEEGLFYRIEKTEVVMDPGMLAHKAAEESILGAGIGIVLSHAVLTFDKLPAEHPLFQLEEKDLMKGRSRARALGKNAARLVRRQPFSMEEF
jgi:hypothetical protein